MLLCRLQAAEPTRVAVVPRGLDVGRKLVFGIGMDAREIGPGKGEAVAARNCPRGTIAHVQVVARSSGEEAPVALIQKGRVRHGACG